MLPHGLVVDRAQDAHVERDGVADHAALPQKGAVALDQALVERTDREVLAAEVARQAVHGPKVVACRAEAPAGVQVLDLAAHVGKDRLPVLRCDEEADHLVGIVGPRRSLEPADDAGQCRKVAVDALPHERLLLRCRGCEALRRKVPLPGLNPETGGDLPDAAPVCHLIIDAAGFARDRRGSELDFYCCHNDSCF